jgi:two-component system, NtrC family, response regulator PilR
LLLPDAPRAFDWINSSQIAIQFPRINTSSIPNFRGDKAVKVELPELECLRVIFTRLGFVTRSPRMTAVLERAYKAARVSDATVLIQGETGTGKQVLARAIHALDEKRKHNPFVTVHCSTVHEDLAESELFGHRRGSFSGALGDRAGLFQAADRGTIFLDDVNDLPLSLQPKLLDVLQRGVIRPVGADAELTVRVRVIAAANRQLEPLVQQGSFRADLYHRLNVIRISLPALRERMEDLPALILEFARRHAGLHERIETLEPELLRHLAECPFSGNVRELENTVQRMLFLKLDGATLTRADWVAQEDEIERPVAGRYGIDDATNILWPMMLENNLTFRSLIKSIEEQLLDKALETKGKTRRELAQLLHTSERTLYHKIRARRDGLTQNAVHH